MDYIHYLCVQFKEDNAVTPIAHNIKQTKTTT